MKYQLLCRPSWLFWEWSSLSCSFSVSRLEMSKQILRNHSQDKDCGHATVDLQFARAFGFFDMPERVGSPKFQFIRRHHAAWDGEQSGYSRHGAEGYHEHFSGLPQVFHFGDDHFGEPEAVGDFGMDGW
jgi:hypothetical protein